MKEFYQGVFKKFREKWPITGVTNDEITTAGTTELAANIKHEKYDKVCLSFLCCQA